MRINLPLNDPYRWYLYFDQKTQQFWFQIYSMPMIAIIVTFPDWVPPLDASIVVRERQYISLVSLILLSLLAAIGVAIAVFFLFINIKYRNHR